MCCKILFYFVLCVVVTNETFCGTNVFIFVLCEIFAYEKFAGKVFFIFLQDAYIIFFMIGFCKQIFL